jgi:hypothetical protein
MRWKGLAAAVMVFGLHGVAAADPISEAIGWLNSKLGTHGVLVVIFGDVRQDSHYQLAMNSCDLQMTETITSFVRSSNGVRQGTSQMFWTVPMGRLNPTKFVSRPDGADGAYSCSVMESEERVIKVRTEQGERSEAKAKFCFDQADLAERSLKALADIATACGAKAVKEKY